MVLHKTDCVWHDISLAGKLAAKPCRLRAAAASLSVQPGTAVLPELPAWLHDLSPCPLCILAQPLS